MLGSRGTAILSFGSACVSKSLIMSGEHRFHFDESLIRNGPSR